MVPGRARNEGRSGGGRRRRRDVRGLWLEGLARAVMITWIEKYDNFRRAQLLRGCVMN